MTDRMVRETQRHLAQWPLQPVTAVLAEKGTRILRPAIKIDVMRPLQVFDADGWARAATTVTGALPMAKGAGINPGLALKIMDGDNEEGGLRCVLVRCRTMARTSRRVSVITPTGGGEDNSNTQSLPRAAAKYII